MYLHRTLKYQIYYPYDLANKNITGFCGWKQMPEKFKWDIWHSFFRVWVIHYWKSLPRDLVNFPLLEACHEWMSWLINNLQQKLLVLRNIVVGKILWPVLQKVPLDPSVLLHLDSKLFWAYRSMNLWNFTLKTNHRPLDFLFQAKLTGDLNKYCMRSFITPMNELKLW